MGSLELVSLFLLTFSVCTTVVAYRPVFILHGLADNSSSMDYLADRIAQMHPGTEIYNSNAYPHDKSYTPIREQIEGDLGRQFVDFSNAHPEGFHLICYSQGGILCRALIQTYGNHTVRHFISLSGVLAGYDGRMWLFGEDVPYSLKYLVFLNPITQGFYSMSNWYRDPIHHGDYLRYNVLLPYLDNEVQSDMSETYKRGFTRVKKMVLIGGPDDGLIDPWQTCHFSYYDENRNVVDFRDRKAYKEDWFGLKTMDEQNRLEICNFSGVEHPDWPRTDRVIDGCMMPHLD